MRQLKNPIPMAERYPRTISIELFDAWQVMRRIGDSEQIHKRFKHCRSHIYLALKYGHITNAQLEWKISKYFNDRLNKEQQRGKKLIKRATV